MNPSGVKGWKGKLPDAWNRIPVKGKLMATAVVILGTAFAASAGPGSEDHTPTPPANKVVGHCDTHPLSNVYHRQRLLIVEKCVDVFGVVSAWRKEHDGDVHVAMTMEPRFKGDEWVNDYNTCRQHGFTVVEFVPGDDRPQFDVGQRLELVGTKVLDLQHGNHKTTGWYELHRIFYVKDLGNPKVQRPNQPKLAPPTETE